MIKGAGVTWPREMDWVGVDDHRHQAVVSTRNADARLAAFEYLDGLARAGMRIERHSTSVQKLTQVHDANSFDFVYAGNFASDVNNSVDDRVDALMHGKNFLKKGGLMLLIHSHDGGPEHAKSVLEQIKGLKRLNTAEARRELDKHPILGHIIAALGKAMEGTFKPPTLQNKKVVLLRK